MVRKIRPIGDQTTVRAKLAENVNGGQAVPGGQRDDQLAMRPRRHARWDDQAAIRLARKCNDGPFEFTTITHV